MATVLVCPKSKFHCITIARNTWYGGYEFCYDNCSDILTSCFRSESGSYGKDTRGMIRQHQY